MQPNKNVMCFKIPLRRDIKRGISYNGIDVGAQGFYVYVDECENARNLKNAQGNRLSFLSFAFILSFSCFRCVCCFCQPQRSK